MRIFRSLGVSRFGLDCANFLQAESAGVVMPGLLVFLADAHRRYLLAAAIVSFCLQETGPGVADAVAA
jgi:hypothetical protein